MTQNPPTVGTSGGLLHELEFGHHPAILSGSVARNFNQKRIGLEEWLGFFLKKIIRYTDVDYIAISNIPGSCFSLFWALNPPKEDPNSIQNRRVIKGFQVYITYIDFKD